MFSKTLRPFPWGPYPSEPQKCKVFRNGSNLDFLQIRRTEKKKSAAGGKNKRIPIRAKCGPLGADRLAGGEAPRGARVMFSNKTRFR